MRRDFVWRGSRDASVGRALAKERTVRVCVLVGMALRWGVRLGDMYREIEWQVAVPTASLFLTT